MRKMSGSTCGGRVHRCRVRRADVRVEVERGVAWEVGACIVCGADVWSRLSAGADVAREVLDLVEDGGAWYVPVEGMRS